MKLIFESAKKWAGPNWAHLKMSPGPTCPPKKKVTSRDPFKRINHQKPGGQPVEPDYSEPQEYCVKLLLAGW